ncbi:thermonuclease family protein [Phyllobacterium sp. 22552]|uniref:thermonuclease family protein n=1 Tax=Phyllobacterium sp. 22552 TaxID=3453941 RepID=UPI003F86593D
MLGPAIVPADARQSLYVIDGDTIRLNGETIRIANIDAPETRQAKCDAEYKQGLEAKFVLSALLKAGDFTVQRGDPKSGRLIDKYGRTLATIFANGKDVGRLLVKMRLVRPWTGKRRGWCLEIQPPF